MSYKIAGVDWNDNGTISTEKLSPLENWEEIKDYLHYCLTSGYLQPHIDNVEKALNRLEEQEQIIDTVKEVIEFNIQESEIENKENGKTSLLSRVEMSLRKQLNEKERKLFRNWVLKECFPKELKALEIIKETPEFPWYVTIYKDAYEMAADRKGFRTNESVEELQKKFDLLKEVLK